jgi:hypothetical protein
MSTTTKTILARDIASKLELISKELFRLTDLFSDEQFQQPPFEGSWTPAQLIEHVTKVDHRIINAIYGKVSDTSRNISQHIAPTRDRFLDFTIKIDAPASIIPSEQPGSKQEVIAAIRNTRDRLMDAATTLDLTMTCLEAPPSFAEFTRLELLHFIVYHTQRHVHQLKNMYKLVNEK